MHIPCTEEPELLSHCLSCHCPDHPTAIAEIGGYDASTIAIVTTAVVVAVTAASTPDASWGLPDPQDTLPWEWNANRVASYWSRRPVAVARRSVAVTLAGLTLGIGLLLDRAAGTCPSTHAVLSLLGAPVVPISMGCAAFLIGQFGCTSN